MHQPLTAQKKDLSVRLNCEVLAGYTNDKTGLFSPVSEQKNLVLYEGADIIAALLGGDTTAQLSHIYFHFQNKPAVSALSAGLPPTLDRSMGQASFAEITGETPEFEDFLRVPIITTPRPFRSPSDSTDYVANGIYLTATSAASETMLGESPSHNYFGVDAGNGPSTVFGAALVAARDTLASRDRVFSRVTLATPLTFLAGSQPTIFWSLRIF